MEQQYKRYAVLIIAVLAMCALCTSCSFYRTFFGTWYCKELGIIFSFEDERASTHVAYGSMVTSDGKKEIKCVIDYGGGTAIYPEGEYKLDAFILRAIAKYRNGKLLMYEWNGEYTGKIYVFEQIAPGPTLVTQEELSTAQ